MNVVIGYFNSHGVEWGYRSTDENGILVEQWNKAAGLDDMLCEQIKHFGEAIL